MTSAEQQGLTNIVTSTKANPDTLRLALAGCTYEPDPTKAMAEVLAHYAQAVPT